MRLLRCISILSRCSRDWTFKKSLCLQQQLLLLLPPPLRRHRKWVYPISKCFWRFTLLYPPLTGKTQRKDIVQRKTWIIWCHCKGQGYSGGQSISSQSHPYWGRWPIHFVEAKSRILTFIRPRSSLNHCRKFSRRICLRRKRRNWKQP